MSIFAVLSKTPNEALENKIVELFPNDHYKFSSSQWFISAEGTAREVSDKIGISKDKNLSSIVFSVSGYWGRASTDVWDWMKNKLENADG